MTEFPLGSGFVVTRTGDPADGPLWDGSGFDHVRLEASCPVVPPTVAAAERLFDLSRSPWRAAE
jgi:hypothetical protein